MEAVEERMEEDQLEDFQKIKEVIISIAFKIWEAKKKVISIAE